MGKFTFEPPDDFIKQLGRLADVERIAPMMLDEAVPILESNLKRELSAKPIKSEVDETRGEMLKSIKRAKAKKYGSDGFFVSVRPTGKDSKGVRNMAKLAYLEYGTSKQSPIPVIAKSIYDSKPAVLKKMQEVFEREVEK